MSELDEELKKKQPLSYSTAYGNYALATKLDKATAQNDIATANRSATAYLGNYLKTRGIQDSGLGQSAYTSMANNYANQQAELNKNSLDANATYTEDRQALLGSLKEAINNTKGSVKRNKLINAYNEALKTTNAEELNDVSSMYADDINGDMPYEMNYNLNDTDYKKLSSSESKELSNAFESKYGESALDNETFEYNGENFTYSNGRWYVSNDSNHNTVVYKGTNYHISNETIADNGNNGSPFPYAHAKEGDIVKVRGTNSGLYILDHTEGNTKYWKKLKK